MLELKRHIAIFTEYKIEVGSVSYYSPGSEHDDGVVALLINCHKTKQYMKVGGKRIYVEGQLREVPEIQYGTFGIA